MKDVSHPSVSDTVSAAQVDLTKCFILDELQEIRQF